jgi:hypothetical protein
MPENLQMLLECLFVIHVKLANTGWLFVIIVVVVVVVVVVVQFLESVASAMNRMDWMVGWGG